jgi:ATP-dependent 26S proteasome regulatory subunit
MKSQEMAQDVTALLKARNPLLWVVTREEARVEKYLFEAAAAAGYLAQTWDIAAGLTDIAGKAIKANSSEGVGAGDPDGVLNYVGDKSGERGVYIMRDLPTWLKEPVGSITLRRLRNLARSLPGKGRDDAQAIIVISPTNDVPAELSNNTTVLEWPLPDREEIAALLDATLESLDDKMRKAAVNSRDAAIDAAVGLSGEEAQATFARSLVQLKRIDPAIIAAEKQRVVSREGILEWFDPIPGGLNAVGGLENLKTWLVSRAAAYSPQAREYGLPSPKGAMLVGVPGCGKSLTAKAIATAWGVPLLRLDLGALKSKYVGESEGNLRKALEVIAAIGRCVVWIDEIEKALDGATSGSADGGVSADALGAILSWMQDRQGEAFVIATANNAEKLPPELLRKGRFDEVWWVDLPTCDERASIINAALKAHGRDNATTGNVNPAAIAGCTELFTGAEISALVPEALFTAFNDGMREVSTDDLMNAAKDVVPLAKSASEKINRLREFWLGRARPASLSE